MMAPNMTIESRKLAVEATRNTPIRKSYGGRMGSAAQCSQTMNSAMNTTDTSDRSTMVGERHAYWVPPHTVTRSAAVTPTIMRPAPRKSIRWDWRRKGSLSTAEVTTSATMPMGRLM